MKENIEGILCYFLTWITGLIFFVLETKNRFVRFHAMQSFLTFLVLSIVLSPLQAFFDPEPNRFLDYFLVNLNPELLPYLIIYTPGIISEYLLAGMLVFSLIPFFLWLFLMYKAYRGERYSLPVVGPFAEKVIENIYKS